MDKQRFLKELRHRLKRLKRKERDKYVAYYEEIIADIMENGVSENEAVKRQGSPKEIAEEIMANTNPVNLRCHDWRGVCLTVVSVFLLLCCIIPKLFQFGAQVRWNASVGIIGGADGPTSILVAAKIGTPWGLYIATGIVVVVTVIYFVKKYRGRRS